MRRQIKAKPAGAQACGVTSATARRILQSLERMSSPLAVSSFGKVQFMLGAVGPVSAGAKLFKLMTFRYITQETHTG